MGGGGHNSTSLLFHITEQHFHVSCCRSSCAIGDKFENCNLSVQPICRLTDDERMGIYGAITLISIIINFIRSAIFYLICINASRVLHNRMFGAIIRTPIRFFDTNPSGKYCRLQNTGKVR